MKRHDSGANLGGRPSLPSLVKDVCRRRPAANALLEQFLLTPEATLAQGRFIAERAAGRSIVFLGDDDHVSIIASSITTTPVTVVEVDERVTESLKTWKEELGLDCLSVVNRDIRMELDVAGFDAFYANPPFSSKNDGHGIRYWVSRGIDLCSETCLGIVAMPVMEGAQWVDRNWLDFQRFITENGFRIVYTSETDLRDYEAPNDIGIRSQNVVVSRVLSGRRRIEPAREGPATYR